MPRSLTDTEALLWNLEQDPNLASTMGAVALLSGTPDSDRLRSTVAAALAHVPAMRERVYEPSVPLALPRWGLDDRFDLDSHLRFIRVRTPASRAALFELATALVNDPFDRTRPLWSWTVVSGLPRGRAALVAKLHHSVADGQGALKLAEHFLEFSSDAPPPEPTDAATVLAGIGDGDNGEPCGLAGGLRVGAERVLNALTSAAETLQDPTRVTAAGQEASSVARTLSGQVAEESHSELWATRSRNRRARFLSLPVAAVTTVSKQRGRSFNDIFVAACARGVLNYHAEHGIELPSVSVSVVVSTRNGDDADAQNAFAPAAITLPGHDASSDELIDAVAEGVAERRRQLHLHKGLLGPFTGLVGLLPASVAAAATLDQTRRIDISTSNLPGPPTPVWLAGQRVEDVYPLGPVAGTACNLTIFTYADTAYVGLHIDPAAITDPARFTDCVADGFADLGVRRPKSR